MAEPVGREYGLEPLVNRNKAAPLPDSRSLVSEEDWRKGTEFGGVDGVIQPPPHVPTASERLSMIYAIDPTDTGVEAGSVAPPELEGNF